MPLTEGQVAALQLVVTEFQAMKKSPEAEMGVPTAEEKANAEMVAGIKKLLDSGGFSTEPLSAPMAELSANVLLQLAVILNPATSPQASKPSSATSSSHESPAVPKR